MMEWQPIETAPKYQELIGFRAGTGVFLTQFGAADIFPMREDEIEQYDEHYWFESWWYCDFDGAARLEGDLVPTHWMPLPQPPSEEDNAS